MDADKPLGKSERIRLAELTADVDGAFRKLEEAKSKAKLCKEVYEDAQYRLKQYCSELTTELPLFPEDDEGEGEESPEGPPPTDPGPSAGPVPDPAPEPPREPPASAEAEVPAPEPPPDELVATVEPDPLPAPALAALPAPNPVVRIPGPEVEFESTDEDFSDLIGNSGGIGPAPEPVPSRDSRLEREIEQKRQSGPPAKRKSSKKGR